MENTIDAEKVLRWYSGKARANMIEALSLVNASCVQNFWVPKASRRVAAMLSKATVAINMGRKWGSTLEKLGGYDIPNGKRGWDVMFLLRYGSFRAFIDWDAIKSLTTDVDMLAVIDRAHEFYDDLQPLRQICKELDAKRPLPVVTYLEVSPTVTRLLEGLGLSVNIKTLRMCPSKVVWVKHVSAKTVDGEFLEVPVQVLDPPPGTVFGRSRYAAGTEHNDQCEACGHAIKNPWNWVPLLIDDAKGTPHFLWVGSDCGKNLFGVIIRGTYEISEGTP